MSFNKCECGEDCKYIFRVGMTEDYNKYVFEVGFFTEDDIEILCTSESIYDSKKEAEIAASAFISGLNFFGVLQ